jgi:hypothetical protein
LRRRMIERNFCFCLRNAMSVHDWGEIVTARGASASCARGIGGMVSWLVARWLTIFLKKRERKRWKVEYFLDDFFHAWPRWSPVRELGQILLLFLFHRGRTAFGGKASYGNRIKTGTWHIDSWFELNIARDVMHDVEWPRERSRQDYGPTLECRTKKYPRFVLFSCRRFRYTWLVTGCWLTTSKKNDYKSNSPINSHI